MPSLDKTTLSSTMATAFALAHGSGSPSAAEIALANSIGDAIDTYIKDSLEDALAGGDPVAPGQTIVA